MAFSYKDIPKEELKIGDLMLRVHKSILSMYTKDKFYPIIEVSKYHIIIIKDDGRPVKLLIGNSRWRTVASKPVDKNKEKLSTVVCVSTIAEYGKPPKIGKSYIVKQANPKQNRFVLDNYYDKRDFVELIDKSKIDLSEIYNEF